MICIKSKTGVSNLWAALHQDGGVRCLGPFFVWLHHFLNMAFKVIRLVDVNSKVGEDEGGGSQVEEFHTRPRNGTQHFYSCASIYITVT